MAGFKFYQPRRQWRFLHLIMVFVGFTIPVFSQITIEGAVTDQNNESLIGVNVLVKNTDKGTATNLDGEFVLEEVSIGDVLLFSYVGYQTQEVTVNDEGFMEVVMLSNSALLDEVVVVGYGTQKKSDLTGAVQRLDASKYENQAPTNFLEMLNGTVAGFNSNQGTKAEGGGSMLIRGQTSLKANTNPLIVLDGVIYNGNLSDINPSDIKSIDILKDASSAAIYGARSASGVLIISTKRGLEGEPRINFSTKIGMVGLTNIKKPFGPAGYLKARGDMYTFIYDKPDHYYTEPGELPSNISIGDWMNYDQTPSDDPIDMWLNRLTLTETEKNNYREGNTINWLDEVLQKGIRQDYDFSISGGSPKIRYFWSAGYTDNEGYIKGDQFKAVRTRINVDADVSDFLKLSVNAHYSDRDKGFQEASLNSAITGSPYGQIYDDNGNMLWYTHEEVVSGNPLIYYTYRDLYDRVQTLFGNLAAEVKLPIDISYKISFVNRYSWNGRYLFDPIETPRGGSNVGYGQRQNNNIYEWQIDNIVNWQKTINENHRIDFTFLYNIEKYQRWYNNLSNTQFAPSDALSFHAIAAGVNPSINSDDDYSTGNALMGRVNYSLLDKYLITATWRRDGYSAFGGSNPYAKFPSIAFGWRLSDEDFFTVDWVNYLKLRTSWGVNGNRAIGIYDALAQLRTVKYLYGNELATGVHSNSMANSNLKWERTEAFNIGMDFSVLKDHISGTIDVYSMTTSDLLLDRTLPNIIGYSSVASNLGELQNKGIEVTLNSRNVNIPNAFQWESSIIFSLNRNKIIHLYGDKTKIYDDNGNVTGEKEADDITNQWFIGESIDRIWEYKKLGIWQTSDADEAAKYGRRPGDIKLQDVNGDGKLQPLDDKVFQGYKKPQYRIGVGNDISFLKSFNLSMFIRADLGFYRINLIDEQSSWIDRRNIYAADYWTPDNPNAKYSRLDTEKNAPYKVWQNSSFLRLQDISLSYTVSDILSFDKIQNMNVYINLRNYLTLTKWDHWDPESGQSPMPKYFTAGIRIDL
ncbi:SusC/RagA family TonB-linked outer membrane protein [Membranicola marinus]|uniref:SusC/RagA family TonB-linked outer membrane protein n=1 Tax=Membranihabitans marinus TaxID=1227546 RepID=A0A953HR63_9BACT|nr:SusC/RagA family TonB-linked outer membrane protein [Membranihabitans marinus]MBY5960247.1 SusC/RagA family TonB-linked outer membrane protein [Membranihabitans marinus]